MTLYWWSHWFWITVLSNLVVVISLAHAYPSQEISLENNRNDKSASKPVTKLYQASSTTATWATNAVTASASFTSPTATMAAEAAAAEAEAATTPSNDEITKTKLKQITPERYNPQTEDYVDEMVETDTAEDAGLEDPREVGNVEEEQEEKAQADTEIPDMEATGDEDAKDEEEHKRSAENFNKTRAEQAQEQPASTGNARPNHTNFNGSSAVGTLLPASDSITSNQTVLPPTSNATSSPLVTSSEHSASLAPPSTPQIDSTGLARSTVEWLNTASGQPLGSPSSLEGSVIRHSNHEEVDGERRAPFTLENVNREDELRRAESEHRTRKSKVLNADYKQINHYINYSADSKSLLTRSAASTTPNDYVSEDDSNIASEALAVQRTYFLDAGTISAICFTVFGICCTVGTLGIVLYRRRYLNKPQALSEPDSSAYIDDSTMRVSDNSDEMYSLDNDSFLNSLEAMTIQNYWTDTVKHTKL